MPLLSLIAYIILFVYLSALALITLYCLLQFHLLYYYQKNNIYKNIDFQEVDNKKLPFVTIQLPIFNERYVTNRLIDNIMQLQYPKEKLQIQILDDSTDDTIQIAQRKVQEYQQKGFDIQYIHRIDREGYKAGALRDALPIAKGEFIAIFDADFLPRKNFLLKTIPHFESPKVGVVQTRWEHINESYSLITRLQALQLNVHFTVEQSGRKAANCMLQFNGTAGVWRRKTIDDAGGWEADTLTEDLDLSYRAQLNGWEIIYLENIGAPAELPVEMNGLKSQQFRWMKGGAENAKKLLPRVWQSSRLNFRQKLHATGHLLNSGLFLFVFIAGLFSVPLVFLLGKINMPGQYLSVFFIGLLSVSSIYYVGNVKASLEQAFYWKRLLKFLLLFPLFLSLSMGLSLHNSIAVIQGYLGKKSAFIRTPKYNILSIKDSFKQQNYLAKKLPLTTIGEGVLAFYYAAAVVYGFYSSNFTFLIFHISLALGFGFICFYSIKHLNR